MADLKAVRTALEPLPALLDEEKWDAVRSVLKVPPVGNLWNLGDSKNQIRKLAELRDDVELFEVCCLLCPAVRYPWLLISFTYMLNSRRQLADDVAGALQLADQFTYDNNCVPPFPSEPSLSSRANAII